MRTTKWKTRQQSARRMLPKQAPLFARLQALAKDADKRFRGSLRGLDIVGLNIGDGVPSVPGNPYCSPLNSKCFGSTGGEGVHFSFLAEKNDVRFDELPVIVTIPASLDIPHAIVGENLHEFLCLGCHRGYFALEQLGHDPEKTLDVYSDPQWQAQSHSEFWVGFGVDEMQREVLEFLRKELQLFQWPNLKERFRELQDKYLPRLRIPEFA